MRHHRSRYQNTAEHAVLINLTPFGWMDFKYWLIAVAACVLLLIVLVFGLPAFASNSQGGLAQFYRHSLAWATLGQNAPLSHFPLATALCYLAATSLGLLLGFLLLLTRIELNLRRLVQLWRTDLTVLFAAISLAGLALLTSVFLTLPFTEIHLSSLQTHTTGVMQTLLMYSLQSRWGLFVVCLMLFGFSLSIMAISVLAPCLAAKAARHDLLVDD